MFDQARELVGLSVYPARFIPVHALQPISFKTRGLSGLLLSQLSAEKQLRKDVDYGKMSHIPNNRASRESVHLKENGALA
jgi:hypothetical protein